MPLSRLPFQNVCAAALICLCCALFQNCNKTVHVTVLPDGRFEPQHVVIESGDTVQWKLADPTTDAIIPVDGATPEAGRCSAYLAYDHTDPNEFTGPMKRAVSGIFVLGPQEMGWTEMAADNLETDCILPPDGKKGKLTYPNTDKSRYLCQTQKDTLELHAAENEAMQWTWEQPDITGVFIRIPWKHIQPRSGLEDDSFDFTALDREISRAVQHGKMYSLVFKAGFLGTPAWLTDSLEIRPVERRRFRDGASRDSCGSEDEDRIGLANPGDENYRYHYEMLLSKVAERIKRNNAWYRALAYIKPSGANRTTPENGLPKHCYCPLETGANACNCPNENRCVCNPQEWADLGYRPEGLFAFYENQFNLLLREFPGKDLSYMLLQNGFPMVSPDGESARCEAGLKVDAPADAFTDMDAWSQTERVLEIGHERTQESADKKRFVVQHNGLGVNATLDCRQPGIHPKDLIIENRGDRQESDCPNQWVVEQGTQIFEDRKVTAFQTNNTDNGVNTGAELEAALENAWEHSDGIMVEIYEELFWKIKSEGATLSGTPGSKSFAQWNAMLHERRQQLWKDIPGLMTLPNYWHTFRWTDTMEESGTTETKFYYVHGSKCDPASGPGWYGTITLRP